MFIEMTKKQNNKRKRVELETVDESQKEVPLPKVRQSDEPLPKKV